MPMAPWKSRISHKSTHSTHRVNLCVLPSPTELVLRCICLNKLREMSEAISPTAHDDSLLPPLSAENNHTLGTQGLLMLSQSRKTHPENTCKWRKEKSAFVFCFPPSSSSLPSNSVSQAGAACPAPAGGGPWKDLVTWNSSINSLLSSHSSHVGTAGKRDVWTNPRES